MARWGKAYATFYEIDDLSTALSDGAVTWRQPIRGYTNAYKNREGDSEFIFVNDTGLNTMAAIGNVCWVRIEDADRVGDFANGWTFAEPFIIRERIVGPEPHQLTIRGENLVSELKRFTIYRPLGHEVIVNTTLAAAVVAPDTSRTLEVGAPAGNNSFQVSDASTADLHKEIRIQMDDTNWFTTVVQEIREWEGEVHLACRDRIPVDASATNAVHIRQKRVRVASTENIAVGQEITITLNSGSHNTLIEEGPGGDNGDELILRDGVTGAANSGNAVQTKDYSTPSNSDVTQVMGYAAGWSTTFETGTGTQDGTRYGGGGDTVYDILQSIADETGEYFRFATADAPTVGPKRTLVWRRTADTAGVGGTLQLVMPSQSNIMTDAEDVNKGILIEKPRHAGFYDPVTQIIPVSGDARVTLYSCSSDAITAAAARGYTVVTTGLGLYAAPYVKDAAADTAIGVHQRRVSFSDVTVEGENVTAIQSAADKLLMLACNYLDAHATAERTIDVAFVTGINVLPGNKLQMDYTAPTGEYSIDYTGTDWLYVQSVRREIDDSAPYPGVPITYCTLTTQTFMVSGMKDRTAAGMIGTRLKTLDRMAARLSTPKLVNLAVSTGSGTSTPTAPPPSAGVYLPLAGGTMTGNIAFSSTQTVDGVDISAHAAADDAHHDPVTAGDTSISLSGQAASVGLNATAAGLEVSSGLRVKRPANSGIGMDSYGVWLSPTAVSASSTSGITGSDHTHTVTASANTVGAATASLLKTDTAGGLSLDRLGVGVASTTSAAIYARSTAVDDYTLYLKQLTSQTASMLRVEDVAGDALIVLTGDGDLESGQPAFVSGLTGWQISATGDAEFNDLWARGEFHASIFVADELHATGGTVAVMTATKVAPPDGANINKLPANFGDQFYLYAQAQHEDPGGSYFAANDIIRCKWIRTNLGGDTMDGRDVYLQVNSVGSLAGRDEANDEPGYYPLYVKWLYGGETGYVIPTGTAIVKWAESAGSGYTGGIILTSDLQYAPYIDIFTVDASKVAADWMTAPITPTPRVRLGNLDGVLGLSEQWGMAAGTDLSDSTVAAKYIVASDAGLTLRNIDLKMYDGSDPTVELSSTGVFYLGTDVGANATRTLSFNPTTGALRLGPFADNCSYLNWDGTTLGIYTRSGGTSTSKITFDSSGNASIAGSLNIGSSGGIWQGTGGSPSSFSNPYGGLKIWNNGGAGVISLYDAGSVWTTLSKDGISIQGSATNYGVRSGVTFVDSGTEFAGIYGSLSAAAATRLTETGLYFYKNGSESRVVLASGSTYILLSSDNDYLQLSDADLYIKNKGVAVGYTTTPSLNRGQIACDFAGEHDYNAIVLQDTTDIAHGMTSIVGTGTYATIGKYNAATGGAEIGGYSEATVAVDIEGYATNESTTKATTSLGAVVIRGLLKSGTSSTTLGSNANIAVIRNSETTRFIFDADGDFHADVSSTTFDDHNDVQLLRAADLAIAGHDIDQEYGDWLQYNRADLTRLGLMSDEGFVNITRMQRLLTGAIWQLSERLNKLEGISG